MTSVNTNASATTALRTLQQTNKALETTQNRISTGLKIGEAKDNAAYWSISTTLKSDNKSLSTVKDALGLGAATVDVAYQGLNKAKEVLDEIKSKLTSATQAGVDRAAVQADISALQDQLKSIATSSTFSGENWLSVDSSVAGYSASKSIVASFSRDANNTVTIGTVDVDTSKVALFDANAVSGGLINAAVDLKKADGTTLLIGGVSTGTPPAAAVLTGVTAGAAGTNVSTGTAAVVVMGDFSLTGMHKEDTIKFDLTVDGGATRTISVATDTITDNTSFLSAVNGAINSTFGSQVATASINTAGKVVLTSGNAGTTASLNVTAPVLVDGNGVVTGTLGLSGSALATYGTATAASTTAGTFAAGAAADATDGFTIQFTYDGSVYTTALLTANYADKDAAATAFAAAMNTAIGTPGSVVGSATAGGVYTFATAATGEAKSISVLGTTITDTDATYAETDFGLAASTATAFGTSTKATYAAGTLDTLVASGMDKGDTISFDLNVTGVTKAISISTEGFAGTTGDRALFAARVQAELDKVANFGANTVKVDVDGTTGAISFSTVAKGSTQYITLDNVVAVDGDGKTTTGLGLATSGGIVTGGAGAPATKATAISTNAFVGPLTLDADDSLSFTVKMGAGATKTVTINKTLIDAQLGGSTGTIANIGNFVTVAQAAMTAAGISDVTVADNGGGSNKLKFEAVTPGLGALVVTDAQGVSGSNKMSVDKINITASNFTALSTTDQSAVLSAYIKVVNDSITKVTSAAASLGSVAKRVELQQTFVDTLMDTIDKGVGNLIDADLSEESTRLQALQTKQQLGVQALSIANSGTQQILRLFQ
ncbi:hypothetical protein ASG43_21665 [Aureimonas sp. Leaf454]|uniref:flagellin N-terminal helical domain-containing protein n=1 Tax=Aureimonas sp. Leaf454 TaxID=1736381 RepID=UPI0006F9D116|nr:hypothetical protein ASG43_21665 [Aureimonas sp. Leaf454]